MSALDLRRGIAVQLARLVYLALAFRSLPSLAGGNAQSIATVPTPAHALTSIAQLSTTPAEDFLSSCPIRLTGTVTLVDTNRHLLVLQDDTGAAAFQFDVGSSGAQPGASITLSATDAFPSAAGFPAYPFHPCGSDICKSFEAPANWGEYHLTRMRALLRPTETGTYTFWIASDNSSELWLSQDADPRNVRKVALVPAGNWTGPREWSKFPQQKSAPIPLVAGHAYYIDAFQEQMTFDDNISVAWKGPGINRAVIDGRFLEPWSNNEESTQADAMNGVLREYWTNYAVGNVVGLTGPRPFAGVLTLRNPKVTRHGRGVLPDPRELVPGKPLSSEDRFQWMATEGTVDFAGFENGSANLEISTGQNSLEVRISGWDPRWAVPGRHSRVLVEGVCGDLNQNASQVPGVMWSAVIDGRPPVAVLSTDALQSASESLTQASKVPTSESQHTAFNVSSAIVTFNGRVFGSDYLYIQQGAEAMLLSQARKPWGKTLQVGQLVQVTGPLLPGKNAPTFQPYSLAVVGSAPMPTPNLQWPDALDARNQDGLWTELEGVGRTVNRNGTLKLMRAQGPVVVWVGGSDQHCLDEYVDSALRVRGVLSLTAPGAPILLVPSPRFIEVEEARQHSPFARGVISAAQVKALSAAPAPLHRVCIRGNVTWSGPQSLFLQDSSGGICIKTADTTPLTVGNQVEALGFPDFTGSSAALVDAIVRKIGPDKPATAKPVAIRDLEADANSGTLVKLKADFVSVENHDDYQVINLHEGHRPIEAILARSAGPLAPFLAESRLELTGVSEALRRTAAGPATADLRNAPISSVRIWLRSPRDVVIVNGPPWLTWKLMLVVIAVGSLVVGGSAVRVYVLRRRLARQEGDRLNFAREMMRRQELERRRIAGNLHDSLGQDLQVIKYQARLAMQPTANGMPVQARLDQIEKAASQALDEVREITHDLRPYQLDQFGLTRAIRGIIQRLSDNSSIDFASDVDDIDGLFDNECQTNIFRIVQEALTNVIKHSAASEVTVVVKKLDSNVTVSIRDNGRGLEFEAPTNSERSGAGFGLISIDERTRILGGTTTLNSKPGDGFNLTVQIPLPESNRDKESNSSHRG